MLTDQDIVLFTYADWHASWSTPQQIATRLAPGNRVLYVDQPRSFLYGLKKADSQGAGQWEGPRLQEVRESFWVYHLPHVFLPIGGMPLPLAKAAMDLNGRVIAALVKRQMKTLGFEDAILWNFSPLHGRAVRHLPHALALYDIADVWVNYLHSASGRGVVQWVEEHLCRTADLVLPSTENMAQQFAPLNPETHVVHHAADYPHFAQAADPATEIPADIRDLPRPIIGSVGVIDPDRFDVGLIEYLSQMRRNWSIVLVGPPRQDMDMTRLETCPNVYLTGNRPIAELPNYLKGMDVTLIPYKVNEATRDIYPLKLQEYLATGKPTVSSVMPSVLPYKDVVRLAGTHAGFVTEIEAALAEAGAPEKAATRQAVARENSWERRVEEKCAHIARLLEERKR